MSSLSLLFKIYNLKNRTVSHCGISLVYLRFSVLYIFLFYLTSLEFTTKRIFLHAASIVTENPVVKIKLHKKTKKGLKNTPIYDRITSVTKIILKKKRYARVAQLVEYDLAKVGVAGSSPVSRLDEMKRNLDFKRFLFIFLPCIMKTP